MAEEKVTFSSNGDYVVGASLSEMDVKQEQNARSKGASSSTGAASTRNASTQSSSAGTSRAGTKKFQLSDLKKNAGTASKATGDKKPAPSRAKKPTPAPQEVAPPAPETPAPTEEVWSEEKLDIDKNNPPVHVLGGDPPIPAYEPGNPPAPAQEETPVSDTVKEQREFKLSQLGLSNRAQKAEPASEVQEVGSVEKLDLDPAHPPVHVPGGNPPIPDSVPAEETDTKASESASASAEEKRPHQEPAPRVADSKNPPFIFHPLSEFLQVTGLTVEQLKPFTKNAARTTIRGVSICQSKDFDMLRSYSCIIPPRGRKVPAGVKYIVTVGWDLHITACYLDEKYEVSDGSANLKCVENCALVFDTPVALSYERNRLAGANV